MKTPKVVPRRASKRLQTLAQPNPQAQTAPQGRRYRILIYTQVKSTEIETTNLQMGEKYEFPDFQRLPPELRQEILLLSLPGPRIIEFFRLPGHSTIENDTYPRDKAKCCHSTTIPALLHVNQECRDFALKFYQPCFTDYLLPKHSYIYMDFDQDTLLIQYWLGLGAFFNYGYRAVYGSEYLKLVQHVAMTTVETTTISLKFFTGLQNVTFMENEWSGDNASGIEGEWVELSKKKRRAVANAHLNVVTLPQKEFEEIFRCKKANMR